MDRERVIVRTGIIGILANVFLAGFKAAIGLISGSIAITLDAVNNLSDALSSVITIISAKLAGKTPDKKHPYGHGRVEYLSAAIISAIVLYAGITALIESVKKIISPETPEYSAVSLVIIGVAIAVKIVLGLYVRKTGERVKSDSLIASGKDALLDAVISASTLVAAVIFMLWGVSLEAWLGAVISIIIIKSGIDMLQSGISSIIGERAGSEVAHDVRGVVAEFPEVSGVYDLVLHNYGPDNYMGSVHVELPGDLTVEELDKLERRIANKVYAETGVMLTGISVYARPGENDLSNKIYADLRDIAARHSEVLQIHGFSVDESDKQIRFDIVIDYDSKERERIFKDIVSELQGSYPGFTVCPVLDADITDF